MDLDKNVLRIIGLIVAELVTAVLFHFLYYLNFHDHLSPLSNFPHMWGNSDW
jgi:hypothetical protein